MREYDVGIIGAGLAGMSAAIQLAKLGKRVLIVERSSYPRHKVCGEFLSQESIAFLERIGLPIKDWNLPLIDELVLSSQNGARVEAKLDVGGIGISRYKLDYEMAELLAVPEITFLDNSKVEQADANRIWVNGQAFHCDTVIASFGKYPPLFSSPEERPAKKYVGVKYHIRHDHPAEQIVLHSFEGGYCGMSKIEDKVSCLCYLIDADLLKKAGGIRQAEEQLLWKNSELKTIWAEAEFLFDKPLTISNIQFDHKDLYDDNFIYVGDAAGAISPLSGNGMSIALHASKLLVDALVNDSEHAKEIYAENWMAEFGNRIKGAKFLNAIMLKPSFHHAVLKGMNWFPAVKRRIVRKMQGNNF